MSETWAILELMGHVRLGGRVSEEERFGVKMGRIDIPTPEGGFVTQLFGGSSVYRMTFVGEAEARAVALHQQPRPVHSWEMPALAAGDAATRPDGPLDRYDGLEFDEGDGPDDTDKNGY